MAVDLPTSTAQEQPRPDKPVFISVRSNLEVLVGEEPTRRAALGSMLDKVTGGDKQTRIFLRADKTVPYGQMMEIMNLLRSAGYLKIGLVGLEAPAGGAN